MKRKITPSNLNYMREKRAYATQMSESGLSKREQSSQIAEQVAAYLACGNKITKQDAIA